MQSSSKTETTNAGSPAPDMTPESAIEHAKRAFALKKYEQAVEHYATALELVSQTLGEDSPEIADLYFAYGKALLENAISQSSVLGKDQPEDETAEDNKVLGSSSGPILSFSGDAEDLEEDTPVDLFAQAAKQEIALKLADCYITLGDVSLETEKFDQAITDYEVGLTLKSKLLPSEAHYKLSIVLDLTSGRLADSITHAEQALQSIQSRLGELESAKANPSTEKPQEVKPDPKGKGKASAVVVPKDDAVRNMSATQIEGEIKELGELKNDLALKIEELKMAPNETLADSAPAMVAQALDKELAGSSASAANTAVVNDLTSMVRKKKAPVADAASAKRKADDEEDSGSEKKPKLDAGGS
ncbi:hypothetical protein BT96DRAFT_957113 [Gymnopus androsaceus JB14]|uniref:Tetratricopeptide SHNi-TPR domain-containing protein n=1 Tax=Gymnopus androsaceus JB14 TaxID=1447944 RepID=A0A6A4HRC1_9AGAR|nr:hypothetical protein BT96DRAFT_957113 [Gymnopus androsaceus JB14]